MTGKTLLLIQSYKGARDQVHWSLPSYQIPGWDILGTMPEDSQHDWPAGVEALPIGRNGYLNEAMIKRWVRHFEILLSPHFKDYTDFFITEYDSVFLSKPPEFHPAGLFTRLGGGPIPGSKAKQFFHPMWWVSRHAAGVILREGQRMIQNKEWELYSPDFFLGRIVDNTGLGWSEGNTWSCNGNGIQSLRPHVEKAVRGGAWFVHGLRTKEELDWLMSLRP